MKRKVLAIGAHPDDIEFMMAGTLLRLAEVGYVPHMFVVGSGSCGTMTMNRDEAVHVRLEEARNAAQVLGAQLHEPVADDLEITYTLPLLRKVAAVVRKVQPSIVLTHSPDEYMEDHNATCRLAVTATFARGMQNFVTNPVTEPFHSETLLYHSLPYGLTDSLGKRTRPDLFVDVSTFIDRKAKALACHESQQNWLDESQGLNSYIQTMIDMSCEVGGWSKRFSAAEGWRRHNPLGFGSAGSNPLLTSLGQSLCLLND